MDKKKEKTKIEGQEGKPRFGVVSFERRRHPRVSLDLPIEYHRIDSPVVRNGRTINASEGGLLVYLSERLEVGQNLKIKLFIASAAEMNALEMLAQVVWVDIQFDNEPGDFRTGLKFVEISPQDLDRLKKLLRNLSR